VKESLLSSEEVLFNIIGEILFLGKKRSWPKKFLNFDPFNPKNSVFGNVPNLKILGSNEIFLDEFFKFGTGIKPLFFGQEKKKRTREFENSNKENFSP